jgi:hypothetical protein
MAHTRSKPDYRGLLLSMGLSLLGLILAGVLSEIISAQKVIKSLLVPLTRLILLISLGLVAGEIIEALGWTRAMAKLAAPLFRFSRLGDRCSAAFTTAFVSGVAANSLLVGYFRDNLISRRQLVLTNFVNQLPAYFLHLPTTFFIVVPLTRSAGLLYFLLTFMAALLRTGLLLIYGRFFLPQLQPDPEISDKAAETAAAQSTPAPSRRDRIQSLKQRVAAKFPRRITRIATWVVPIYVAVFILSAGGMFDVARQWLARYVTTTFVPMESLSVVILSFAAEFTSGFAAAGALLDAGVLTVKQTVLALITGNILAFPVRALRHQLPRYVGIFSPKMGTELLLMGQLLRVISLVVVAVLYYLLF